MYGHSIVVVLLESRATFAWWSASLFPGMPKCPRTTSISAAMLWAWRAYAFQSICLANCCPGPVSQYAVRRTAACESLKTATVFTLCSYSLSLLMTFSPSAGPIADSSATTTSISLGPISPWRVLHSLPCLLRAAAPTRLESECDPSVHYIETPAQNISSFSLAQLCAALLTVRS